MSESRKFRAKNNELPSAVILKGFNDREWKFILRSGYERLIRDKLPPHLTGAGDVQDVFVVARANRIKLRAARPMRNKNRTLNAVRVLDLILCMCVFFYSVISLFSPCLPTEDILILCFLQRFWVFSCKI